MHDEEQKRMVETYEITQAIRIGDREILFGVDEKQELPYFCGFYEEDIVYTYEQYREHLEMMKRFSQMHKNYHIEENKSPAFRHIQILIHEGSWAIVSKEKTPAIHFVIRHPKMREAMENITMPIVEGEEYK